MRMTLVAVLFSIFLVFLITPTFDVSATKSDGVSIQKYGSKTSHIVCGDKLCSEVREDRGSASQQSRFSVGGVAQQGLAPMLQKESLTAKLLPEKNTEFKKPSKILMAPKVDVNKINSDTMVYICPEGKNTNCLGVALRDLYTASGGQVIFDWTPEDAQEAHNASSANDVVEDSKNSGSRDNNSGGSGETELPETGLIPEDSSPSSGGDDPSWSCDPNTGAGCDNAETQPSGSDSSSNSGSGSDSSSNSGSGSDSSSNSGSGSDSSSERKSKLKLRHEWPTTSGPLSYTVSTPRAGAGARG